MLSEYCGKQQYGFSLFWFLGRLRMTETLFGVEIMTVGYTTPKKHLRCKKRRVQETTSTCNPM